MTPDLDQDVHPLWRHRALRYDGTFPLRWRVYFFLRLMLVRSIRGAIAFATWIRWPWAVFQLMALQRRLGFRFDR